MCTLAKLNYLHIYVNGPRYYPPSMLSRLSGSRDSIESILSSNNKTELCLHIFVLPSAMMALFASALNCIDPSSYGTYYNRLFYSVVLTLELTTMAKHTILPAGIVLRCATKAAELDESPHVSNALYETTLPCVCVRYPSAYIPI